MQHRPSVLAAAATIMAYDHQLTRAGLEVKINSIPTLKFLEIVSALYFFIHLEHFSSLVNASIKLWIGF